VADSRRESVISHHGMPNWKQNITSSLSGKSHKVSRSKFAIHLYVYSVNTKSLPWCTAGKLLLNIITLPYSFPSRRVDRDPACRGCSRPCWRDSVCRLQAGFWCSPASRNQRKTVPLACWIVRTGDSSETRKEARVYLELVMAIDPMRSRRANVRRFICEKNEAKEWKQAERAELPQAIDNIIFGSTTFFSLMSELPLVQKWWTVSCAQQRIPTASGETPQCVTPATEPTIKTDKYVCAMRRPVYHVSGCVIPSPFRRSWET